MPKKTPSAPVSKIAAKAALSSASPAKATKATKARAKAAPVTDQVPPAVVPTKPAKSVREGESAVRRVVLAYSGGLDTSIILKWLKDTYNCEVGGRCARAAPLLPANSSHVPPSPDR